MGCRDPQPPAWCACADDGTGRTACDTLPSASAHPPAQAPDGGTPAAHALPCDGGRLPCDDFCVHADPGGAPCIEATVRVAVMDRTSGRPAALPRSLLDTLGAP